jgi:zinc/manganese transport system substrate-binding protein/manganese/iron transport system substrate-binding protein
MRTILTFFIVIILVGVAVAAVPVSRGDEPGGLGVVATTPQAADLVRAVAGEHARVTQVVAANSDPHDYEPRPSDAEALAAANLIVRSGAGVDGWLDQLVASSGSDAPVLVLADHVRLVGEPDGADPPDPHWWQDPRNAELAVVAIERELGRIDPAAAPAFAAASRRYRNRLERLDHRIAACLRTVPVAERRLVTSHDALAYYARRYRIGMVGAAIPALTTEAQASAGETAELVELIEDRGVPAVFPEAGVSAELERAIAEQAGARVGAELWTDTLAPPGSPAATYIGSLAANTRAIVAGLGGEPASCRLGS